MHGELCIGSWVWWFKLLGNGRSLVVYFGLWSMDACLQVKLAWSWHCCLWWMTHLPFFLLACEKKLFYILLPSYIDFIIYVLWDELRKRNLHFLSLLMIPINCHFNPPNNQTSVVRQLSLNPPKFKLFMI